MNVMENFKLWDSKDEGNTCILTPIQGLEKTYRLINGVSLLDVWPNNVCFHMDPNHPKDIGLADNLQNLDEVAVVSSTVKEFLAEKKLKNVEFLPISIINHKDRVASREYFVVNPVNPQDCIDLEKSEPTFFDISPNKIQYVKRLVIDPKRVDQEVIIFRVKSFFRPILIRAGLAEAISAQPFTGFRWNNPLEINN